MDISQSLVLVGAGIDTANKVVTFVKGLRSGGDSDPEALATAKEQILEVKEALYAAKDSIFTLKDQLTESGAQIKELERRLAQRDEYALEKIGPGAFAYVQKNDQEALANGPWLCQSCFDDGRVAVLQFNRRDIGQDTHKCPRCESVVRVPNDVHGFVEII